MFSTKDRQGVALIAGVVVVLAAVLIVRVLVGGGTPPPSDYCVGQPAASTVIVLDRSDDVSAQTLAEMRSRTMTFIRDSTKEKERVSIFSISDLSQDSLIPLISVCRPPDSGSRFTENVQVIRKRFVERFEKPIEDAVAAVPGPAPASPLAQAFIDLSLTKYLRSPKNNLLIFSDMMENTGRFSLYRCADTSAVVAAFRTSRQGARERPKFTNTMVSLHLIPRLNLSSLSLICRDKLWLWFFGDNPGSEAGLAFDYLPGGAPVRKPTAPPGP